MRQDPSAGFVSNYTLLVGDSSFANFQKVCVRGSTLLAAPLIAPRQVLDLKGTPKAEQNELLDLFVTMTSTMTDLEGTSFLSSLDMDPHPGAVTAGGLSTPNSSALSLPSLLTSATTSSAGLMTPPLGSGTETPKGTPGPAEGKREVFSDLRRLVSFAVRREREGSTSAQGS